MLSLRHMVGKVLAGVLVASSFAMVTTGAGASTTTSTKSSVARTALSGDGNSSLDVTKFQDPNPQVNDSFGGAMAVSSDGTIAVVGAQTYSQGSLDLSGATYVFMNDGSSWNLVTALQPSDLTKYQRFGYSVSITPDGHQIVVGADDIPYGTNPSTLTFNIGKVYIFEEPAGGWSQAQDHQTQAAELVGSDVVPDNGFDQLYDGAEFGFSVSQSDDGSVVLVGARLQWDFSGGLSGEELFVHGGFAGEAYVYSKPNSGWSGTLTEDAKLLPSQRTFNAQFGWSVRISTDGSTAFVTSMNLGEVFIFEKPSEGWGSSGGQLYESDVVASPNTVVPGGFGFSLAVSADGTDLAVSSPSETVPGTVSNTGAVFMFVRTNGIWVLASELVGLDSQTWDGFGYALSFSPNGSTLLVGAPQRKTSNVTWGGAAYQFGLSPDGSWSQTGEIPNPSPICGDLFGFSVFQLDGTSSFVGSPSLLAADWHCDVQPAVAYTQSGLTRKPNAAPLGRQGTAYAFNPHASTRSPQQPLTISNSPRIGAVGTSISLSTSGGSGTIAPTFAVTGAGCSISGAQLSATLVTTCAVTATNPANGNYLVAHSTPVSFHFSSPQSALKISNAKLSGAAGTAVKLTAKGGTGSGLLGFSVSGANCTLSGTSLNATGLAQCVVTATKAASGSYGPAVSPTVKFTFTLATQAALKVSNSVKKGTVGTAVKLTASGGSGSGSLSFSVTGSGCAISGQLLTATKAGNCSVKATKATSGIYAVAVSPVIVFAFTVKK